MSRAKAVFIPPAELVVVARSSYPKQKGGSAPKMCAAALCCSLIQNSPSGRQTSCLGTFAQEKPEMRLSGVQGAGSGCRP